MRYAKTLYYYLLHLCICVITLPYSAITLPYLTITSLYRNTGGRFLRSAETVEDEGDIDGEEGAAAAVEQMAQAGIVEQIEAQFRPGCAGTDGREVELGKFSTAVSSYFIDH